MWQTTDNYLEKTFQFDSFGDAIRFAGQVARVANDQNHHPKIIIDYDKVVLQTTTHSEGSKVTEKDHILAKAIDALIDAQPTETVKVASAPKEVKLFTDGGSRGNPGPSALGYVILDMDDNLLKSDGYYLGITTNNQAEYQGLQDGLEACKKLGVRIVRVHMDSLLVVNQMKGIFKVKNRDLWPIHQSIKDMASKNFEEVTYTHVPRELNKQADTMVNETLDAEAEKS